MRQISRATVTLAFLLVFALAGFGSPPDDAKKQAQKAAESWLSLVDSGKYAESWSAAATLFRKAVSQEKWQEAMRSVREPLGKTSLRKLKSAAYSTSLPGVPDGEYVVIQYETSFEHKQSAVETITPMREADGTWKVSGYFIK
jgi:uncharacterized protein DUF4019